MLLEMAIGDAYGAGFEYAPENIKYNDLSKYIKHPTHGLMAGTYTDDTQMGIALAELIISGKEWTPQNIADSFVDCFKRDWRDGYSRLFQKFLESINNGTEFLAQIKPESDKSGAAMRASPIGIFATIEEVKEKATIQAKLTHNTPDGIAAAKASALMSHYFLYDLGKASDLGTFINTQVPSYDFDKDWEGKVKSKGFMSVKAAITAVRRNTKLSELLKDCIAFTGDTDTVATIAMGAASCSSEYKKDLPQRLVDTLENGKYGKDYLIDLNMRLFKVYLDKKIDGGYLGR